MEGAGLVGEVDIGRRVAEGGREHGRLLLEDDFYLGSLAPEQQVDSKRHRRQLADHRHLRRDRLGAES